jgi:hypothetical protein
MPEAFGARVFCEAGEAIGNVGRRLLRRRRTRALEAEQALQRWLRAVPAPVIPPTREAKPAPKEGPVIEGTYRVIHDDEEDTDGR